MRAVLSSVSHQLCEMYCRRNTVVHTNSQSQADKHRQSRRQVRTGRRVQAVTQTDTDTDRQAVTHAQADTQTVTHRHTDIQTVKQITTLQGYIHRVKRYSVTQTQQTPLDDACMRNTTSSFVSHTLARVVHPGSYYPTTPYHSIPPQRGSVDTSQALPPPKLC